ncbi:MAG: DUF4932 domain-containing protein [Lentisphaeria bacterium]|nr:DUF4932 domain-containing protein [Lentisphaeria bacterium]
MKRLFLCLLPVLLCAMPLAAEITVRRDPRIELLSLVFRLAGNPEYNRCALAGYDKALKEAFLPAADAPVVLLARQLRAGRGVSYDAVASLAIHLDAELEPAVPWEKANDLDSRWPREKLPEFTLLLRRFSDGVNFNGFLAKHDALYREQEEKLQKIVDETAIVPWIARNIGEEQAQSEFIVVPALLNGPSNYGPSAGNGDRRTFYAIIGISPDMEKNAAACRSLVTHEFMHSCINPAVDRHYDRLAPAIEKIFPYIREKMKQMAYGSPKTVMYETFVRAVSHCRQRETGDGAQAEREMAEEEENGFYWMGELVRLIEAERAAAGKGWKFEQSFPKYIGLIAKYVDNIKLIEQKLQQEEAELRKKGPKIVEFSPANGAEEVDPATKKIVIRFDRKMKNPGWALCRTGRPFPGIGGTPSYDSTGTTLTVPVNLEPETAYCIILNAKGFSGFCAADGNVLAPTEYNFTTGKGAAEDPGGKRPKILACTPANGAEEVDPATKKIVIRFDREMTDASWSFCRGEKPYPQITGRPFYDKSRTTVTLPVKLEPGVTYHIYLNAEGFTGFRAADGGVLAPTPCSFTTAAAAK